MKSLDELPLGMVGIIKNVKTETDIRRRLLDIGLVPNTRVKCLYESILGNIRAYLIRGSVIAIRKKDTADIEVEFS